MAKRKKQKQIKTPQTLERAYLESLNRLVDVLFTRANRSDNMNTDVGFAKAANVCMSTVRKLRHGYTRLPRLLTVWRLARAVGMWVQVTALEDKYRKAKAKIAKPKTKSKKKVITRK